MNEKYELIDLNCFISTRGEEKTTVYQAIVYFSGKGHNDLLKISVTKEIFDNLQVYLHEDITELIKVEYNSFNKVFRPTIKNF